MAHASITLPKAGFSTGSTSGSFIYNTSRPEIPAEWMADGAVGQISIITLNSASPLGTTSFRLSVVSGDLIESFENSGFIYLTYAGLRIGIDIGTAVTPDTAGGNYQYGIAVKSELQYQLRTMYDRLAADKAAGDLVEDPVLTLWDEQGDDPFPDETLTFSHEQELSYPAARWDINSARWAVISTTPRMQFDAAFAPAGEDRYLEQFILRRDRAGIIVFVGDSESGSSSGAVALSDNFLTKGHIELTVSPDGSTYTRTLNLNIANATILDRGAIDEPYRMDWEAGTPEYVRILGATSDINGWPSNRQWSSVIKFGIVGEPPPLPDAVAPTSVVVNAIADGDEGTTVTLGATITGGTYDDVAYEWFVYEGNTLAGTNIAATVLDNVNSATPVFTRPTVSSDTDYTIGVRATVSGTGTNAKTGTSDARTSAGVTTTVNIILSATVTAPDWSTPSLKVTDTDGNTITSATEGATVQLHPLFTGGTYDVAKFRWRYRVGSKAWTAIVVDTLDQPYEFVLPDVSADTSITFQCRADFTGDGTTVEASAARKRPTQQTIGFTINDAVAPTADGIDFGITGITAVSFGDIDLTHISIGDTDIIDFT